MREFNADRLGVTIHGYEPLGPCALRFRPGMDAIVGANGVGKTRLASALSGRIESTTPDGGVLVHYSGFDPAWHFDVAGRAARFAAEFADASGVEWRMPNNLADIQTYAFGLVGGWLSQVFGDCGLETGVDFFDDLWGAFDGRYALWRQRDGWEVWACLSAVSAPRQLAELLLAPPEAISPADESFRQAIDIAAWHGNPTVRVSASWWQELFRSEWAAAPLVKIGQVPASSGAAHQILELEDEHDDADRDTREFLRLAMTPMMAPEAPAPEPVSGAPVDENLLEWTSAAERLALGAQALYSLVLDDPPALDLVLDPVEMRSFGTGFCTWVIRTERGPVPLSMASDGLRRWGTIAVELALAEAWNKSEIEIQVLGRWPRLAQSSRFLVLDEPERGINRRSERILGRNLIRLLRPDDQLLVTTHSAGVLGAPGARVSSLVRGETGEAFLRNVDDDRFEEQMLQAGISRAELYAEVRLWVLVEGFHDQLVLGELFRSAIYRGEYVHDLFRYLGVKLVSADGASRMAAVVQIIAAHSPAPMMVVTDKLDPNEVSAIQQTAARLADSDPSAAVAHVSEAMAGPGTERSAMKRAMVAAINEGAAGRFHPHPIPVDDILLLLPSLVSGKTWEELRQDCADSLDGGLDETRFKKWLSDHHDVDLTDSSVIKRAISKMDVVPSELAGLYDEIYLRATNDPVGE